MHAHLQVIVTLRKACVLGSMCLIMMILTGFAGVAPHQVLTLALPQITQQTHLVVSNRVRIILKTVALHVVSNLCHLIWEGLLSLAISPRFHQQIFFPFSWHEWYLMCGIVIQLVFTTCSAPSSTFLQSSQVKRSPKNSINEFIIRKLSPLAVADFRFISAWLHA